MSKYEVIKSWHGVSRGQTVEIGELHPALASHVRLIGSESGELSPATPGAKSEGKSRKEVIADRLTELGIEFKGNLGAEKLSELLPDGEIEKLFPAE